MIYLHSIFNKSIHSHLCIIHQNLISRLKMRKIDVCLWIVSCILLLDIHILPKIIVNGSNHDLFASLFELEMIWENELEVVEVMERVVRKWIDVPKEFKM